MMKKLISAFSIAISVGITIYYLHFGGLFGNESALSKIGLTHRLLFILWGVFTYLALAVNIHIAFRSTKFKFYIPLLIIAMVGMLLTLSCDFNYDKYSQYILHCIGSLTFSALMGILVLLLFILKKNWLFSLISAAILIVDLILLLIYKETALIEITPIFVGFAMLLINNLGKEKERIGIKQQAQKY